MATKQSKPRKGKFAPRTYWAVEVDCDWAPGGADIVTEAMEGMVQIRTRAQARNYARQFVAEGYPARVVRVVVVERGSR